jgi:gliding motility-associated-like protein
MQLTGTNQSNQNFALNWTPYQGYGSGILEYQLEIMDENGVLVGAPIGLGPNATSYLDPITQNRQISQYRIVALSNDSIPLRSFSNIIKVDIPLQLFIPNSFTPNNDGLNDTFQAKGLFIDQYSMEIYNQWGELVFHTAELEQGWDGVYKGTLSPEDTYVYRIQATDTKGRVSVKNGTLHLLRLEN